MLSYFTTNTIAESICFLIALLSLYNIKSPVWKAMVLFLFIICVTEFLGIYFKKIYLQNPKVNLPNIWLYNILLVFQTGFISYMLYTLLSRYGDFKWPFLYANACFAVLFVYEIAGHNIFYYANNTNIAVSIFFVLCSFGYYYYLSKDDKYTDLRISANFWWVGGVLLFYFGRTACNIFYDMLSTVSINPKHSLTYYIYNFLNILLYGCWSYSFICKQWEKTK
jgi:hypothetical protein